MCGRITQKSSPNRLGLGLTTVNLVEPLYTLPPKYNGAPGQEHWVIRQNPKTGERTLDRLWWGLIPYWCKDASGGRKPINAKGETVASLPSFRDAYRRRRCLLPVDNFFEWRAIKGARAKQPYAIAMKSGQPFALAGIWENWQKPGTEEWLRTFAIITTCRERPCPRHSRSHAGYRTPRLLRSLALRDRAGPARYARPLPARAHAHVADLHSRQQARPR